MRFNIHRGVLCVCVLILTALSARADETTLHGYTNGSFTAVPDELDAYQTDSSGGLTFTSSSLNKTTVNGALDLAAAGVSGSRATNNLGSLSLSGTSHVYDGTTLHLRLYLNPSTLPNASYGQTLDAPADVTGTVTSGPGGSVTVDFRGFFAPNVNYSAPDVDGRPRGGHFNLAIDNVTLAPGTTAGIVGHVTQAVHGYTPTTVTGAATNVGETYATVSGTMNATVLPTGGYFGYGTPQYISTYTQGTLLPASSNPQPIPSTRLTGLTPGTRYVYGAASIGDFGIYVAPQNYFVTLAPHSGTALSFDGTGQYVQMSNNYYFTGPFSVEAWVYPRSVRNWARILDFGNGPNADNVIFGASEGMTGQPFIEVYANGVSGGKVIAPHPLPLNTWTHVAATFGGGQASLYINGLLAASGPTATPATVFRTQCYLARSDYPADSYADEILDEVRIWNTTRQAPFIPMWMNIPWVTQEPDMLVNLHFDDATGTTVSSDGALPNISGALSGTTLPAWVASTAPLNGAYQLSDTVYALRIAAGLAPETTQDLLRLDSVTTGSSNGAIDLLDAVDIARKTPGFGLNP